MDKFNVKIITVNANGLRSRKNELNKLLTELNDKLVNTILLLNDTRLNNLTSKQFKIPGYSIVRKDKNDQNQNCRATAGGVAIAVPETWSVEDLDILDRFCDDHLEAKMVVVCPPGCEPLKIASVYNHPGHHVPIGIFTSFKSFCFNQKSLRGFIGGDLNCPHTGFGSRFDNEYGKSLLKTVNQENLVILNNGDPTFYHSATGDHNLLDLFLCEASSVSATTNCYIESDIGTDHMPVCLELEILVFNQSTMERGTKKPAQTRTIIDRAKQNRLLNDFLQDCDFSCNSKQDIDVKVELFTDLVSLSKDLSSFQRKNFEKKPLPPHIVQAIKRRKELRRLKRSASDQDKPEIANAYNRANRYVRLLISEYNTQNLESFAQKISSENDVRKMWKLFNNFKKNQNPSPSPAKPFTKADGSKTESDNEKADVFVDHLRQIFSFPENPLFDSQWKAEIEAKVKQTENELNSAPNDMSDVLNRTITPEILRSKVMQTRRNSAPGEDKTSYEDLRLCNDTSLAKLCQILNACLKLGYFPSSWKHASVKMVPKPNKDISSPTGYRPISLLSCVSKCFERIIGERLYDQLESLNFFNEIQTGFRKKRSTQEHLLRLAQEVHNAFKKRNCTVGVFLDVSSAFDAVWLDGLKFKINKIKIPANLKKLLFSFLDDRSLHVNVNGCPSLHINLEAGTPQGSCISPLLYCIFVNDLPCQSFRETAASQFADDIGIWSSSKEVNQAEANLQFSLHQIEKWCATWRITLNHAKSQVILFSRCPRHSLLQPSLFLFGNKLNVSSEAIFLGVKLCSRLTWKAQIDMLITKAQPRVNLLKALSHLSKETSPKLILSLYKSTVRPIFEYACIAYMNAAPNHLEKLQQLQNSCLRSALKLPAHISTRILHDAADIPMLKDHLLSFAKKRLASLETNSRIIRQLITDSAASLAVPHHKSPLEALQQS